MKKTILILSMLTLFSMAKAQVANSNGTVNGLNEALKKNELLLKIGVGFVKGGMPLPLSFTLNPPAGSVTTGTIPFPQNKIGLNTGVDFNHYFTHWGGLSVTADYFSNAYKKIETSAPFNQASIVVTQKNQVNIFTGAGIIARKKFSSKFSSSAALYGGYLLHNKKNYTADYTVSPFGTATILSFASNKAMGAVAAKGSLRVAYSVNQKITLSAGAELILPFFSTQQYAAGLLNPGSPYTIYYPVSPNVTNPGFDSSYIRNQAKRLQTKFEPGDKLKLYAFNVAIKFALGGKQKSEKKEKPQKNKGKECCGECPVYGLTVTARDKYTKVVLPNTDVVLVNKKGEIVKTARTNGYGVVVFEKIVKDDYTISGKLNDITLENALIAGTELICDEMIQKEILYADRNFIIKGKAVVCNTTTPISGINVSLENKVVAFKKSTMTDADGVFILHMPEVGTYQLYGRKDGFFSQIEEVTASNYDREKTLFVQLEICAEKADCDKAFNLKNILFDLDKYIIKEAAKKELNRLVQFMKDNPGVIVELSSHTDCRNTAEYNQTLSQNRANASVDYIVSQGIERSRLIGKGYGETKLLNRCADGVNCTEAEHSINRRTEMKVICPNK